LVRKKRKSKQIPEKKGEGAFENEWREGRDCGAQSENACEKEGEHTSCASGKTNLLEKITGFCKRVALSKEKKGTIQRGNRERTTAVSHLPK